MKGFSQWWTRSKSLPWIKSRARKENYIYVGLDIDSAKKERERNRWTGRYGCCSADERDLYEFLSDHFIPPFLYFLYGSREGTNGIQKCNTALLCFPRRPLLSIRLALKKKNKNLIYIFKDSKRHSKFNRGFLFSLFLVLKIYVFLSVVRSTQSHLSKDQQQQSILSK